MGSSVIMVMSSPVSIASVYIAKFIVVSILILFAQALFVGLYWVAGTMLLSIPGSLPLEVLGWTVRGWYASLSIIALQLGFSIRIRSFATPIGISLCAVFLGLGMYVANLGYLFPFSLLTIGMSVLSQEGLSSVQNMMFLIMTMFFIILFSTMSIRRLKHRDIVSS